MASSSKPPNQLPDEDRLSNLPDSLICHILSFLPTKCAVITSALSTKWRYQWTSVANLVFCDKFTVNYSSDLFENFVDRVLMLRKRSNIDSFTLACINTHDPPRVNTWITAAAMFGVRELRLSSAMRGVVLPHNVFYSRALVALTLGPGIVLDVIPTSACLPSLKVLHLEVVEFRNVDTTWKLFNACPVLEDLVIRRETTDNAKCFNVCAPALKRLTMKMYDESRPDEYWRTPVAAPDISDYTCVIDCPTLEHLDITDYTSVSYAASDMPLIVKAEIDTPQQGEATAALLRPIADVKLLTISDATLRKNGDLIDLPTFSNLTKLELRLLDDFSDWTWLLDMLRRTPVLQGLVIDSGCVSRDIIHDTCQEREPSCLLSHLETFELRQFKRGEDEMELLRYILRSAKVLKEMTIESWDIEKATKVLEELLGLPRCSRACRVVFS
ncbi:hypothetical protein RJ639_003013 [Escallonia herrerae]|uniref:FBD domain-containing protein n=1 Tax=Escallonia herrerae TaxID=1293975 RepID=A0AA89B2X6_9ASTE|nr:hypothetical protein RJ639_003013 [Escallonia herrerae]